MFEYGRSGNWSEMPHGTTIPLTCHDGQEKVGEIDSDSVFRSRLVSLANGRKRLNVAYGFAKSFDLIDVQVNGSLLNISIRHIHTHIYYACVLNV